MAQIFEPAAPDGKNRPATVSLGRPFRGCAALVVGKDWRQADIGELWLGGPQITQGYINNDAEMIEKFVTFSFHDVACERWYRSGDLVRNDEKYGLIFEGRLDDQVKIQGYRIELLEVEEVLRNITSATQVAVVVWPISESGVAEGLVAFVCAEKIDLQATVRACRGYLPNYMVPKKIMLVDQLMLNANGKVDRRAMRDRYLASRP